MSKHQIIYTSCKRGINGVSDGQQIYSYDKDFQDSNSQDVRSLFSYRTPTLDYGVVMSEEIALTMPKAFTYRKLYNKTCAITLNTYLGRDYMGSEGRFGNYLSHSIICDESEYTYYPCEFYGSKMFRSSILYDEVNNPNKPDFLPTPELIKGNLVNLENVVEFLLKDDRMDIFKNMLHAVLLFETERKRLVICDEPENIIMWIAALEYSLPLKIALNINFSTYDYDPSLSYSQICGVVLKGTKYSSERPESLESHYVFDLYKKDIVYFDKREDFSNFVQTGMLNSYNSLKNFHKFLMNSYSYYNANLEYYNAYLLYKLRHNGILGIDIESFVNAVSFLKKYSNDKEKFALTEQLLAQKEIIFTFDNSYLLEIFGYISDSYNLLSPPMQEKIRDTATEKIVNLFRDPNISNQKEFINLYENISKLSCFREISLSKELMKEKNLQVLLDAIQKGVPNWKLEFTVDVFYKNLKAADTHIDNLLVELPVKKILELVLNSAGAKDNNTQLIIYKILDGFSNSYKHLINITFYMEKVLLSSSSGETISRELWIQFYQVVEKSNYENRNNILSTLSDHKRFEQMYNLFECFLNSERSSVEKRRMLKEHYNIISKNKNYAEAYLPRILGSYYAYVKTHSNDINDDEIILFQIVCNQNLDPMVMDGLLDNIVEKIPVGSPSEKNSEIINVIYKKFKYNYPSIGLKILPIYVGMKIEQIKSNKDLPTLLIEIKGIVDDKKVSDKKISDKKVSLLELNDKDIDNYLDWIIPHITSYCNTSIEIIEIYELFSMSQNTSEKYIARCAHCYLKQINDREYEDFCEFLKFLVSVKNANGHKAVCNILLSLNKKNLELLDFNVITFFKGNKEALDYWESIRENVSKNKSTFDKAVDSIRNIFKKR